MLFEQKLAMLNGYKKGVDIKPTMSRGKYSVERIISSIPDSAIRELNRIYNKNDWYESETKANREEVIYSLKK